MTTSALKTRRSTSRSVLKQDVEAIVRRHAAALQGVVVTLQNLDFLAGRANARIDTADLDAVLLPLQQEADRRFLEVAGVMPGEGVTAGEVADLLNALASLCRTLRIEGVDCGVPRRTVDEAWTQRPESRPDLFYEESASAARMSVCGATAHGKFRIDPDVVVANITQRVLKALCVRAGTPPIRFHDLRHIQNTVLAMAGVSAKVMQERAGHHSAAYTVERYSWATPDMQAVAVEALERTLPQKEPK